MSTTKKEEAEAPVPMYKKLHTAKLAIGKVHKNATNPHFKRTYADLSAVLDACESILLENGLLILQPVLDNMVVTKIIDIDSGEFIESFMRLPELPNPQAMGSVISYYRRYTLSSLLTLAQTDDDSASAARAVTTPAAKPTLTDANFQKAIDAINEDRYTVDELKSTYSLTKDQESKL